MKINKIFIVLVIVLMICVNRYLLKAEADIYDSDIESISYLISPLGRAEYNNLGVVDLNGRKVNLVTLRTKVLLFENIEKIYSDPVSLLPYKIDRTVSRLLGKDHIIEEYNQEKFTVSIKKFKGRKLVKEKLIKADGPIQNVILFLFYLSRHSDLEIGWYAAAQIPAEFKLELDSIKLELVSIDNIRIPAGKFEAYHFKSIPDKFEIWINKNTPRIPLKIKSKSIVNYSILMKKFSLHGN
jgi:hypothetical protein